MLCNKLPEGKYVINLSCSTDKYIAQFMEIFIGKGMRTFIPWAPWFHGAQFLATVPVISSGMFLQKQWIVFFLWSPHATRQPQKSPESLLNDVSNQDHRKIARSLLWWMQRMSTLFGGFHRFRIKSRHMSRKKGWKMVDMPYGNIWQRYICYSSLAFQPVSNWFSS